MHLRSRPHHLTQALETSPCNAATLQGCYPLYKARVGVRPPPGVARAAADSGLSSTDNRLLGLTHPRVNRI